MPKETSLCVLFFFLFLPPANEVCEGYVFTGVCLSTGGCLPHCMLGYTPTGQTPSGQTDTPLGRPPWTDRHPPPGQTPPCPPEQTPFPCSACLDTANKRAVRIPLKYILVLSNAIPASLKHFEKRSVC